MPVIQEENEISSSYPQTTHKITKRWFLSTPVLLAVFGLIIYIGAAFAPPALLDDADSTHAEVAREMALNNDWVTLKMDGIKYYEKDPLMYWLIAGSFKMFGVAELPARLPIVLSAILAILAAWALGKHMFGSRAGLYSGLVMATSVGPFLFTRILIPDLLLTAVISWGIYFFLKGMDSKEESPRVYLLFYVCGALAFLTKSMIGVVFPAVILVLYLLLTRSLGTLKRARIFTGSLLFIVIAAPWSIVCGIRNEHFLWFHYINEQVLRYLGKRYPKDYGTVPLAVFYGLHALWIFPWTIFFPAALTYFPRKLRDLTRDQRFTLLLGIWAVVVIGFFSFSTRQEYYTLPAIPALAILCGRVVSDLEKRMADFKSRVTGFFGKSITAGHVVVAVIGVVSLAAAAAVLIAERGVELNGDITSALTQHPSAYALSLGHIFDLTPRAFAALRLPVAGAGLAMSIGGIASFVLYRKRKIFGSAVALSAMMAAMFFFAHQSMKVFQPYLSSKEIADAIMTSFQPGDRIVINGEYESGSTLNFYTGQPVYLLNHRTSNLWYGSYLPDAPFRFYTNDTFLQQWREPGRVYLDCDADDVESIRQLLSPSEVFHIVESGDKVLLSNRP